LAARGKGRSCEKTTENEVPAVTPGQGAKVESGSSDDEFESLMGRIRKRLRRKPSRKPSVSTAKGVYQPDTKENIKPPGEDGEGVKTPRPNPISPEETPPRTITPSPKIPRSELEFSCSQSAKTEKRVCSVPGCFLEDLANPASRYVKYFKKNKEELAQKLYCLYNRTIFQQKLPEKLEINWNKKMRKSAGYCFTGQIVGPETTRYARIELSTRVCDSADRLRDTLIHEACHA
ncbi:ACRC protein, partial [Bucco capensis]|nr:ACRC protein [Bucco capensis]